MRRRIGGDRSGRAANFTLVAANKFVPVMVIGLPPRVVSLLGLIDEIVGISRSVGERDAGRGPPGGGHGQGRIDPLHFRRIGDQDHAGSVRGHRSQIRRNLRPKIDRGANQVGAVDGDGGTAAGAVRCGLTVLTVGGAAVNVYWSPGSLIGELSPARSVTVTSTVPAPTAGTVAVILVPTNQRWRNYAARRGARQYFVDGGSREDSCP